MAGSAEPKDIAGGNRLPAVVDKPLRTRQFPSRAAEGQLAPLLVAIVMTAAIALLIGGELLPLSVITGTTRQSGPAHGTNEPGGDAHTAPASRGATTARTQPAVEPGRANNETKQSTLPPPTASEQAATSTTASTGQPADIYVGGSDPARRPADAPMVRQLRKTTDWYARALHGLDEPYAPSMKFLEDQGSWHTPFDRPGMTGPYDIRNWHGRP